MGVGALGGVCSLGWLQISKQWLPIKKYYIYEVWQVCPCLFSTLPSCPQSSTSFEGLIPRVERSKALLEFPPWEKEERTGA